jgi:DoxX-like family
VVETAHVVVAAVTAVVNAFSGTIAVARYPPVVMASLRPALATVGVPESWLVFPIGTLKLLGAAGLTIGLLGMPLIGAAAATGLVGYWLCAVFSHLRVADRSPQFLAASGYLALAIATLTLGLTAW